MGRPQLSQPPVPIEFVREAFQVRQDGCLVWRERPRDHFLCRTDDASRFNNQRAGEPAGFKGPGGKPLVRLQYEGCTRRLALLRVAWIVATGELPHGVVRPRDGDEWNASAENLIVTKAGPRPFDWGKGGKASSLERRAKAPTTLINALVDHPGATVPQLSRLVGSSAPCVCTRLGKLADAGVCVGPKCDARARWDLTERGRALAAAERPLIDDLDRRVLAALAVTAMGTLKLARRVEVCPMTIFRAFGSEVPAPVDDEAPSRYRARLYNRLARRLPPDHKLASVRADDISAQPVVLDRFEEMLIDAAKTEGERPSQENLPTNGEMISRARVDAEALSHQLGSARRLEGPLASGRGGGSPRPERFVSEDAKRTAGSEMTLDVERVVDGGVNGQEPLG